MIKQVLTIQLRDTDWKLRTIPYGEESPMADHLYGEIAADDENKVFYCHEAFIVTNGLNSIENACMQYPALNA